MPVWQEGIGQRELCDGLEEHQLQTSGNGREVNLEMEDMFGPALLGLGLSETLVLSWALRHSCIPRWDII